MTRRGEQGAAAVEMALVMPLLFMLLFGIVVFGIHLFRLQSMESAVREGGRLAAIGAAADVITERVFDEQQIVPAMTDLTVTMVKTVGGAAVPPTTPPCTTGDAAAGARVEVTAVVNEPGDYAMSIPFISTLFQPDFTSSASFRCES